MVTATTSHPRSGRAGSVSDRSWRRALRSLTLPARPLPRFAVAFSAAAFLASMASTQEGKPAAKAAAGPAAMLPRIQRQFDKPFAMIFRTEMHFLRIVAEPTKAQYDAIAAAGQVGVEAALRAFVQGPPGGVQENIDPRNSVRDAIVEAARATLAPEKAERYRKEIDLRAAAYKRMAIDNLVALIDRFVVLRSDQRPKLAEVLAANWNPAWNQVQLFISAGQRVPPMPDDKIESIFSDAQRAIWRGVIKRKVQFGFDADYFLAVELNDEVWDAKP